MARRARNDSVVTGAGPALPITNPIKEALWETTRTARAAG
jgi:hypothetical protein